MPNKILELKVTATVTMEENMHIALFRLSKKRGKGKSHVISEALNADPDIAKRIIDISERYKGKN